MINFMRVPYRLLDYAINITKVRNTSLSSPCSKFAFNISMTSIVLSVWTAKLPFTVIDCHRNHLEIIVFDIELAMAWSILSVCRLPLEENTLKIST